MALPSFSRGFCALLYDDSRAEILGKTIDDQIRGRFHMKANIILLVIAISAWIWAVNEFLK
jgi:hypothetical protein